MTAWGGPLIILALVAVAWAVTDVLRGIDGWLHGGDEK